MRFFVCIFSILISTFCLFIPLNSPAQQMQMITYAVQSGTGFFVNRQNIVTNAHVVNGCTNVFIKGAVPEHEATVRFTDPDRDLAVIETNQPPPEFAPLRYNIDDLKTGDQVMVIGYPGEAGARGEYKVAQAQIQDIKINEGGSDKWLYITDVVDHGNSGGPVLDTSGNVIGVVVAKAAITMSNSLTHEKVSEQNAGVVITLKTLMQFLLDNGVFSELGGSGGVIFSDSYLEERARNYIVNVQCRIKKDNVQPPPTD